MIIDFHTHIFPDKIASKTIEMLSSKGGIPAYSDGSLYGLIQRLKTAGAERSIALPVLTSPTQFESVLRFTTMVNQGYAVGEHGVLSFAGIHPLCDDISDKMKRIKECGFKGIKIHPDYQQTYFDNDRYIEILLLAKQYDLIVVTHAGVDGGYRDMPVRCTPDRILKVLDKVGQVKLVLAHYGSNEMASEVYDKLAGAPVYFDTAYVLPDMEREMFVKIANKHGYDKILFATDSPWRDISEQVKIIKSFDLGDENQDKIFYKNALKLLGEI